MSNQTVIQAWNDGKVASTRHLTTDGQNLYSYQMLIGRTIERDGRIMRQVLDVSTPNFYSMTTSQHVGRAKRVASEVIQPVRRDGWYYFPDDESEAVKTPLTQSQIEHLIGALREIAESSTFQDQVTTFSQLLDAIREMQACAEYALTEVGLL